MVTDTPTQPVAASGPSTTEVVTQPDATAGSSVTTPATDTPDTKESAKPEPDRLTLTPEEFEREVERRLQKGLPKIKRSWERDYETRQRAQWEQETRQRQEAEDAQLARDLESEDYDVRVAAETRLAQREGAKLLAKHGQKATEAQLAKAIREKEAELRAKQWQDHAAAFEVDPEDDEILSAEDAKTFAGLNKLILQRTPNKALLEAAWSNPGIQARVKTLETEHAKALEALKAEHAEALQKARAAGTVDGQARLLSEGGAAQVDVSANGTGRLDSYDEIVKRYTANPTPANAEEYRKARAARGRA